MVTLNCFNRNKYDLVNVRANSGFSNSNFKLEKILPMISLGVHEDEEERKPDSYDLEKYISNFINKSQIPFKIWTLRFPQPEDLRTSNLDDYLSATNTRLKELLEETHFTELEV